MGWGGFLFGLIACSILVWEKVIGKGKSLANIDNKIDDLHEKFADVEARLDVVDGLTRSVSELVFEWRGIDGTNGYKSIIKRHDKELIEITRRNDKLDAVREEDERRSGGQHRRLMDRELNNLIPEKREDKP